MNLSQFWTLEGIATDLFCQRESTTIVSECTNIAVKTISWKEPSTTWMNLCCNATLKQMVSCVLACGLQFHRSWMLAFWTRSRYPRWWQGNFPDVVYRSKTPKTEPCLLTMTADGWNLMYHHAQICSYWYLPFLGCKSSENPKHFIVDC